MQEKDEAKVFEKYTSEQTALLLVDPYNDFMSVGGKIWPALEGVATKVDFLSNLRKVVGGVRKAGIRVFVVPHRRWEAGDYESWDHPTPYQLSSARSQVFARGSWGGEWHPEFAPQTNDIIIKEHWGSSGFANTDLDFQLKQNQILKVILVGLIANTCIECTGRFATELGYHVTLIKDATAAFAMEMMHAAHVLNGPTFAHRILTAAELLKELSELKAPSASVLAHK